MTQWRMQSGALLNVVEVEARTGFDRKTITEMIVRGSFPRSVAKDNRGNRQWREWQRWSIGPPAPRKLAHRRGAAPQCKKLSGAAPFLARSRNMTVCLPFPLGFVPDILAPSTQRH